MGVKVDLLLQCLPSQVMGGNGPSKPGGNLGLKVPGFRFSVEASGLVEGPWFRVQG